MPAAFYRALDHPYCVPAAFSMFFALRVALIFLVPINFTTSDEFRYFSGAIAIASGERYALYFPVGYSAFLAIPIFLFGSITAVAQLSNLFLACLTFLFTFKLAKALFGDERVARLAVILLTIYPNQIAYTGILFSENLLTPLVLAGTYFYVSRSSFLMVGVSGILFGFASLTKAQAILLPIGLLGFHFFEQHRQHRKVLIRAVVLILAVGAVVTPWVVRNSIVYGELTFISTNGGSNLFLGNNSAATGGYSQATNDREFSTSRDGSPGRQALDWIVTNPVAFAALIPKKIWHLWALDGDSEWTYQREYQGYDRIWYLFRTVRILNQGFYLGILVTAILGILSLRFSHVVSRPWCYLGAAFAAYITLVSVVFFGSPRFHFPAMPWLVMYSAGWIVSGVKIPRREI